MPICVAGMHRSGTSLTARLLNLSGLDLGREADMIPAGPTNAEGHWENRGFVLLNDEILAALGGAWDLAPPPAPDWDLDPKLAPYRQRARQLVREFEGREPWGWKDPRNSLTLPFWQRLLPDLKVVICVRHPLEVADSLSRRNGVSTQASIALWASYYSRLLDRVPHGQRLVTHYDSQFIDSRSEMQRILGFAGLPVSQGVLDELGAVPKEDLRHNRLPLRDLVNGLVPREVVHVYLSLCAEAGPVYRDAFAAEMKQAAEQAEEPAFEAANAKRHFYVVHLTARLERANAEAAQSQQRVRQLEEQLESTTQELQSTAQQLESTTRQLESKTQQLQWSRHRLAEWLAIQWHRLRQLDPRRLLAARPRQSAPPATAGEPWAQTVQELRQARAEGVPLAARPDHAAAHSSQSAST